MLIVARHGRTQANAQRLLLGRMDVPLDETGLHQAAAVGAALRATTAPMRVVASPLMRTQATAQAIADAAGGAEITLDDRWLEVDYGKFDGSPLADVPHEVWDRWRNDPSYTPPGGESLGALGRRVRDACESLIEEAAEQNVIVVTHVSPIKAAVAWAVNAGDEAAARMFCDVASISRIRTSGANPILVSFNETAHLAGVAPSAP